MKMKRENRLAILLYFAAFSCYLAAIVKFIKGDIGQGGIYLCLGSSNLCTGTMYLRRGRNIKKRTSEW